MRQRTRSDWVALAWNYYRDDVIEAIADQLPDKEQAYVIALWAVLVCQAHEQSEADRNPLGTIGTTIKKLAASSRVPADKIEAILDLLIEGELVTISTGRMGLTKITLCNYREWNHPRNSGARRKQEQRHREAFAGILDPIVPTLSQDVPELSQVVPKLSLHNTTQHYTTQASKQENRSIKRAVELTQKYLPTLKAESLLEQLTEHAQMSSSPPADAYLQAAIELDGKIQKPGAAFKLITTRARSIHQQHGIDDAKFKQAKSPVAELDHLSDDERETIKRFQAENRAAAIKIAEGRA